MDFARFNPLKKLGAEYGPIVEEDTVSLEDNKVLVQRFIDQVMNAGNTAAIADFTVAGSMFAGGIEGQIKAMKTAFPNHHMTIDDMLAEGNKVAVRVTIHATNTGPLVGLPAFGRFRILSYDCQQQLAQGFCIFVGHVRRS